MYSHLKDNGLRKFRIVRGGWIGPSVTALMVLVLILQQSTAHASSEPATAFSDLAYQVRLDGKPVGRHEVAFRSDTEGRLQVETNVQMAVKVLFVPVFKYRHQAREVWQDHCVTEMATSTRSNGKRYAVDLITQGDTAVITRTDGDDMGQQERLQGCQGTYAYWDRDRLRRAQLINAQNGEATPISLRENGPKPLPQLDITAEHVELATPEAAIELWYGEDGQWLALATQLDGHELVYLAESLLDS